MEFLSSASAVLSGAKFWLYAIVIASLIGTFGYLKLSLDTAKAELKAVQIEHEVTLRENQKMMDDIEMITNINEFSNKLIVDHINTNQRIQAKVAKILGDYNTIRAGRPDEDCINQPIGTDITDRLFKSKSNR